MPLTSLSSLDARGTVSAAVDLFLRPVWLQRRRLHNQLPYSFLIRLPAWQRVRDD